MTHANEALARLALGDFEARQLSGKAEQRAHRWRLGLAIFRALLCFGAAIYLLASHWEISGAQACGFFLIYLATSFLGEHQAREQIRSLRLELDRLNAKIDARPAPPRQTITP